VAQAFGGGQPQVLRDLRPIHVTLMAEVKEGRIQLCWRSWGNGFAFHPGIIPRMVHQRNQRNAPAASGVCVIDLRIGQVVGLCDRAGVCPVHGRLGDPRPDALETPGGDSPGQ
jgi:hypothetical protein